MRWRGDWRTAARSLTLWSSRWGREGLMPVAARTFWGPRVSRATLRTRVESTPPEKATMTRNIGRRMDLSAWSWDWSAADSPLAGEIVKLGRVDMVLVDTKVGPLIVRPSF